MKKQVVIKIPGGDFDTGFPVVLEFWEDGRIIAIDRECPALPAQPEIQKNYEEWQENYRVLGDRMIQVAEVQITNQSTYQECLDATETLEYTLATWFKNPIFGDIRGRIVGRLKDVESNESVRVILDTANPYLRKLSWDRWDLFERDYFLPNAELVLLSRYNRPPETLRIPVRILAIFGSDAGGLQLQKDLKEIQNLAEYGGEVTCIPEEGDSLTLQTLCNTLSRGNWDIIFYAGHSSGQSICLSNQSNLPINNLRQALRIAAPNIKLAIFNSCDGLDIAEYLAEFNIPHLIVMREPVPDQVARSFLKYFLEEFIQGIPLHAAVHQARKALHRVEIQNNEQPYYPGASWLPILLQNPTAPQLYWPQPEPEPEPEPSPEPSPEPEKPLIQPKVMMMLGLVFMGIFIGVFWGTSSRFFKKPNVIGDSISQGEEIVVKMFQQWRKQRGVEPVADCQKPLKYFIPIWKTYIRQQWNDCFVSKKSYQEAIQHLQRSWQEEKPDPETLIYLNNAILEATGADYYTIAIVVPTIKNQAREVIDVELAEDILRGIAQAQTEVNLNLFNGDESAEYTLPGSDFLQRRDLNGKGLKVIIADDSNFKPQAIKNAQSLVNNSEIIGVIGHYASEMTLATIDIYNKNQVVLVTPGTSTSELSESPKQFFFRIPAVNSEQAYKMVDLLNEKTKQKKVTIFYNPASPFSSDYKKHFEKKLLEQGGKVVAYFDLSSPNFNAKDALKQMRNAEESVIILIPDGQVTNSVDQALEVIKENKGEYFMLGNSSVDTPRTLALGQEYLKKLHLVIYWHHLNSSQPDFSQITSQLWGEFVSLRTALAYDAAHVLIEGIRQNPTRKGIQKVLSSESFKIDGVTGKIEFQPGTGDRKEQPLDIVKVVACANQEYGLTFLPTEFSTPKKAGLDCSNRE
ncbi:ABC transporter substrate-binding protein [Limnoraphis robusta]|uniref:ABC transporter substrate-binding protein n=1 Tax=Limnoraphis robusta CCNP1315 TaxID=3110306 RepID=A0ABU5TTF7_9CYAN|nr:ABC transporter substrate-binding protein [Limnoraphis robusta]MEA5518184.1 ABC transporter substrate-binding protein [Limnoraphis robusta CCNP1315]MEA5543372.1 ABC transporter substrate-binding protein [Limnoraphis robusta CCNP1324]